jgi:hypothetical protein
MEVSQFTDAASGVRAVGTCRRPRLFSSTCNYLLLVFFPRACVPSANPSACFQSVCAISRACVPSANPSACFPERVCPQQIPARAFQSVCAISRARVCHQQISACFQSVCALSKSARASQSVCLSERVPLRACASQSVCAISRACVSPQQSMCVPSKSQRVSRARRVCPKKLCLCVCARLCVCPKAVISVCLQSVRSADQRRMEKSDVVTRASSRVPSYSTRVPPSQFPSVGFVK